MDPLLHTLPENRGLYAFRELFEDTGWTMMVAAGSDHPEDILLSSDHGQTYHAVLKSLNEGRSDRGVALFAQALLEARARAKKSHVRAAVLIWVGSASRSLVDRLVDFHKEYGADEPFAVLSMDGTQHVQFPGLRLSERSDASGSPHRASHSAPPRLMFSDRVQWMLKLLLAADIRRENLIAAEPARYRTATDLARAASVSTMTATRLLHALKAEGFLESAPFLTIVRRRQLAERWKAEYRKPTFAVPMKFRAPAAPDEQLQKLIKKETGVLGLFAAAKALGYGHVQGVPPTVWVPNLMAAEDWRPVRRAREGERPDLILQQPSFPETLQRGVVFRDGILVTDIIQTWLDVSAHPARGAEQAAELEHGILANVIGDRA